MKTIYISTLALLLPLFVLGNDKDKLTDSKANRAREASRYLKALPPAEFVGDMIFNMAQNLPSSQRKEFIDKMTQNFDFDAVGKVTMESLVRHLTAEVPAALADLYSSPVGKSAMKKSPCAWGRCPRTLNWSCRRRS